MPWSRRKPLVKSAERSTKWCPSNDDETGVDAVQHLSMLPSTRRAKGCNKPNGHLAAHGIHGTFEKKRRQALLIKWAMLRDAKTTSIAERVHRPPLGGDTVSAALAAKIEFFLWSAFGMNSYQTLSLGDLVRLKESSRKFVV
jgi:hypothetical protein